MPDPQKPTVLVVEDDFASALLKQTILGPLFNVLIAYDGNEMHEQLAEHAGAPIAAIVMNLTLRRGENGLDLVRWVREQRIYDNVPIVAVTAAPFAKPETRALEAGCNGYLAKPFRPDAIRSLLLRLIGEMRSAP